MASVRYRSGAKLAGSLYFNGVLPVGIGKFSGSEWESSVYKMEVDVPASDLQFNMQFSGDNISETYGEVVARPWLWHSGDNDRGAVIWGDGTVERAIGSTTILTSHTYAGAGTYLVSTVGGRLRSVTDNSYVTSIKNMGAGYGNSYGGPYTFPNAAWESTTMPVFIQGPRFMQLQSADFDATDWLDAFSYDSRSTTGHSGSGVLQSMSSFTNAGVGGVGVGIDTWEFPGKAIIASGTVTSLSTNQLVDSTADFQTAFGPYNDIVIRNTSTGASAYCRTVWYDFNVNYTATTINLSNTSNPTRTALPLASKDIFTAVGQSYEIVQAWAANSNFGGAFSGWSIFNQYIGSWNLDGLIDCFGGFGGWTAFNNGDPAGFAGGGPGIGMDNWDVSDCGALDGFPRGTGFNQYINSWNVGNNQKFQSMFDGATSYNRPLNNWNVGEHLYPGQIMYMTAMFRNATSFDQEISSWDMSKCAYMDSMFYNATAFNNGGVGGANTGLDTWDTSNVLSMSQTFRFATFNQDIGNWDVGNVSNATRMFQNVAFNSKPTLGNWGVNRAPGVDVNLSYMFYANTAFNQNVSHFNTSRVTNMYQMFAYASNFNNNGVGGVGAGMDTWDVSICTDFTGMFQNNPSFNQYIGSWTLLSGDTATGTNTSVTTNQLIDSATNFITAGVKTGMTVINNSTSKQATVTLPSLLYNGFRNNNPAPFKLIDTATVDFITYVTVGDWVTNGDTGATAQVVSIDAINELTLTADIFPINNQKYSIQPSYYVNLNSDIFTSTSTSYAIFQSVTLNSMFSATTSFNQDLSNWNTSNVTNMRLLFYGPAGTSTNFSLWDVSRVTNFWGMFRGLTTSLNPDVGGWNISSATDLEDMFYANVAFDRDLSAWDTSNVTNMTAMFRFSSYDRDISAWNISSLTTAHLMFDGGSLSTANYDLLLNNTTGWASQATIQNGVSFSAGGTQYTLGGAAEAGRNVLTGTYGWTIVDGGGI